MIQPQLNVPLYLLDNPEYLFSYKHKTAFSNQVQTYFWGMRSKCFTEMELYYYYFYCNRTILRPVYLWQIRIKRLGLKYTLFHRTDTFLSSLTAINSMLTCCVCSNIFQSQEKKKKNDIKTQSLDQIMEEWPFYSSELLQHCGIPIDLYCL